MVNKHFLSKEIIDESFEELKKQEYLQYYESHLMPIINPSENNFGQKRVEVSFEKICSHCGKLVHTENEEIFTIGYEPSRKQKITGESIRIRFFHKNFFQEIAGEDFMT